MNGKVVDSRAILKNPIDCRNRKHPLEVRG